MARLRLFAGLRDAAGTANVEISGDTVGEVLDTAADRFGERFAAGIPRARIWLNGEEAKLSDAVGPDDEIALLPPVSGGTGTIRSRPLTADALGPAVAVLALIAANLADGDAWWAAAVVGVVGLWVGDIALTVSVRGRDLPPAPALLSIVATLVAVHLMGVVGMGLGIAVAVVAALAWGVMSDSSRVLTALSPAMLLAIVASVAVGSLHLARSVMVPPGRAPGVFLAVAITAIIVSLVTERMPRLPLGDPFSATALGAVAAAVVSAAVWDLDLVAFLITGLAMAVALVAGRGLGSVLRTRQVVLVERSPGILQAFDGVVLAAAVYLPVLRLVLI